MTTSQPRDSDGVVIALARAPHGLGGYLGFRSTSFAKFDDLIEALTEYRAVVVVAAYPIVVRALAKTLTSKYDDPTVIAIDEGGSFVTVLAGAHHGGEQLAVRIANFLGATPILTTASRVSDRIALDQAPLIKLDRVKAELQARLNHGVGLTIVNPTMLALPQSVLALEHQGPDPVKLVISDRVCDQELGDARGVLPTLTVGVGCSSDASCDEVRELIATTLEETGLDPAAVDRVATIERRVHHRALSDLHQEIVGFTPEQLDTVPIPTPSEVVHHSVGTRSVAEAAALLASGDKAELVVAKVKSQKVTVAVARRNRLRGSLTVVGIGPGSLDLLTLRALGALRSAQYLVGFKRYLELLEPVIERGQVVKPYAIGQETERVLESISLASDGNRVALVTSGDPAVYAMAQLVIERLPTNLDVRIVPGVTAAYAASAATGAIVGHDHVMISLSDLLTPWSAIEARVEAAAQADFVIALYNPRSKQRTWQLEKALAIIGQYRRSTTPVLIASRVERPGASTSITTLEEFDIEVVDMETIVIVGASTTAFNQGYLYTPRGYQGAR